MASFGLGPGGLQNRIPGATKDRPGGFTDEELLRPTAPRLGDLTGPQGPIQDPGTYTPGAVYRAPEYRAPDPYQQATPFARAEYQGATPFARDEYQAATPFARAEYQAATPFAAPTAADMALDPGYQFRLSEGQKALERSGAARGVTNTGGTMKGLLDYGQQAASQEYGNVYNRSLSAYNTNEANRMGAYGMNYGNALNAYNTNEANRAGAYATNFGNARDVYGMNEANRAGAYNTNFGNALGAYGMNEQNRAGAYSTNYGNAFNAYNTNEANRAGAYGTNAENQFRQYTTNALAQYTANQEEESRRASAFATNANLYRAQQNDAYDRMQTQYEQGVRSAQDKARQQQQYERDRFGDLSFAAGA